jgi:hypothetical protein
MAASSRSRTNTRPAHDEWGVYDPQQAGLAALYARLEAKDGKSAPALPIPAAKTETAEAAPARPTLRDAK